MLNLIWSLKNGFLGSGRETNKNYLLMKPYQKIPIQDCGEPLVAIPPEKFVLEFPPPYQKLGANYHGKSPYFLRLGVLNALIKAQNYLQQCQPGWQIKIFDAYRPVEVQQFMVDYTFNSILQAQALQRDTLTPEEGQRIWEQVYQMWAIPSDNPATPPPHSTGAAIDLTLVDAHGNPLDLGGEIDELSARSQPNYYAHSTNSLEQQYHQRRQLLDEVMRHAGFRRHPGEWWHFSLGDQMYAWQVYQENPANPAIAGYGKI
jgi:D-alanyl-D-alanine dipeptidase